MEAQFAYERGTLGRMRSTLNLYVKEDLDEMIAAQEKFRDAVGIESEIVQLKLWVKLWVS